MEFIKQSGLQGCYGPRISVKFSHEEMRPEVYGKTHKILDPLSVWNGADKVWYSIDKESDARIYSWEFSDESDCKAASECLKVKGAKFLESKDEMISFHDGFTNFP